MSTILVVDCRRMDIPHIYMNLQYQGIYLEMADPCASDPVGIQWVEGCRNDGNADVPTVSLTGTADVCNYATIGDIVWEDTDQDGIQDGGELGLQNVPVYLYNSIGTEIDNTTTNSSGNYSFVDIVPDDYYLKFIPPVDYGISLQDQGGNDSFDSDASPSTGNTTITTLEPNEDDITWDAGMYSTLITHPNCDYLYAVADDGDILVYMPRDGSSEQLQLDRIMLLQLKPRPFRSMHKLYMPLMPINQIYKLEHR